MKFAIFFIFTLCSFLDSSANESVNNKENISWPENGATPLRILGGGTHGFAIEIAMNEQTRGKTTSFDGAAVKFQIDITKAKKEAIVLEAMKDVSCTPALLDHGAITGTLTDLFKNGIDSRSFRLATNHAWPRGKRKYYAIKQEKLFPVDFLALRDIDLFYFMAEVAYQACEKAGVINTDYKVENVMRRGDGTLALIDWGNTRECRGAIDAANSIYSLLLNYFEIRKEENKIKFKDYLFYHMLSLFKKEEKKAEQTEREKWFKLRSEARYRRKVEGRGSKYKQSHLEEFDFMLKKKARK